jgi:uncharacterized protein YndB with AHSA1/START domain
MHTIDLGVVINQPRKAAWDTFTDPARFTDWSTNVIEYHAERDGKPEVGDRDHLVGPIAGRRFEFGRAVTNVVPAELFSVQSVESPFPFTGTFRFEDTNGGTRLTFHGETPGPGGLIGRLFGPMRARSIKRQTQGDLTNLKAMLEQD